MTSILDSVTQRLIFSPKTPHNRSTAPPMPFEPATPKTKESMLASGFSLRADKAGAKDFPALVASLTCERFHKDPAQQDGINLSTAVKLLLRVNFATDQVDFGTFTTVDSWTIPTESDAADASEKAALPQLSRPAVLNFLVFLSKTVAAAEMLHYELSDTASFTSLATWSDAVEHLRRHDAASSVSTGSVSFGSGSSEKLPDLKLKNFTGASYVDTDDKWSKSIVSSFEQKNCVKFLEDELHCDNNVGWSRAFAASLRESITDSDILGYIAEETVDERNCAKVWKAITSALAGGTDKTNIIMSQLCQRWLEFFDNECDNIDDFPKFNSKFRSSILKLRKLKQQAMDDDMFLKFFIFFKVKVEQFSDVRKTHLSDHKSSSGDLMDDLLKEFKAIQENDAIDGNTPGTATTSSTTLGLSVRRNQTASGQQKRGGEGNSKKRKPAPLDLDALKKRKDIMILSDPDDIKAKMPKNFGNKIPVTYWNQFTTFFRLTAMGKEGTEADKKAAKAFEWDFNDDLFNKKIKSAEEKVRQELKKKNPDKRQYNGYDRTSRRNDVDYNAYDAGYTDTGGHGYSQQPYYPPSTAWQPPHQPPPQQPYNPTRRRTQFGGRGFIRGGGNFYNQGRGGRGERGV